MKCTTQEVHNAGAFSSTLLLPGCQSLTFASPFCPKKDDFNFVLAIDGKKSAAKPLVWKTVIKHSHSAELLWGGLELSSIKYCFLDQSVNGSIKVNIKNFNPTNYTITLTNLNSTTLYGVTVSCVDTTDNVYRTPSHNFTTSK